MAFHKTRKEAISEVLTNQKTNHEGNDESVQFKMLAQRKTTSLSDPVRSQMPAKNSVYDRIENATTSPEKSRRISTKLFLQ